MNIRFEDPEKRYERTQCFFQFLYYNWGDEDEEEENPNKAKQQPNQQQQKKEKNTGTKAWQIYKDVNQYETKDKFGKQALKRDFYNKHVDQKFNEIVNDQLDEEGMKNFNHFCHFYNSLGVVGYEEHFTQPGQMVFERRLLYVAYFFTYPLNIPYSWVLVFLASVISILLPNPRQKNQNLIMNIFEEESMNLSLVLFLAPAGQVMRILINIVLMLWALQHVNLLAYNRLQKDPDTIGLSILTPLVNYINYNKVELNFIKNGLEISLGFIGVPFVFINQAALIFPILFYQYLKVKNMSNAFQKHQWKLVWDFLSTYASPVVGLLKLMGFGKEPPADSKDKKTDEQKLMDQLNESSKLGDQAGKKQQKKTGQAGPKMSRQGPSTSASRTASSSPQQEDYSDEEYIEEIDTADMKKIN